jgi:predicted secreted hydrolase
VRTDAPARHGSWPRVALALAATLLAAFVAWSPAGDPRPRHPRPGGSPLAAGGAFLELGPGPDASRFARATAPRAFELPADHGPHFDYQTEWWYFTGNLLAQDGARFGFQLTFFRRGLSAGPPPTGPGLASNQVYFAHFAVTDVAGGRHVAAERFARGAGGLAGATAGPFAVWLEDWQAAALGDGSWRLAGRDVASGLSLDVTVRPGKPLVAHGDRGLSPKSREPGNASYYVGYTRLPARGRVALGEHSAEVAGEAWFDHEWSTSALGAGAVGWDWLSLQLGGDRELMYFQIRRADGSVEPVSAGTLVEADGRTRRLDRCDVQLVVERRWTSPATGAVYPARWRLVVASEELDLRVEPWLADQEMRTSFVYWEGAVRVSGSASGRVIDGQGYVELTGYGRSMQGVF